MLSHGHPGKTCYVVLDRFGVDAGYMVHLRVAFPVIQRADAHWMTNVAAACNKLIKSLKIKGKNVVTSEVKLDQGVLWLRDLKDPAKHFDWKKGWQAGARRPRWPNQAMQRTADRLALHF